MEQYTVQIYLVILAMLVMSVRIERNDLIERQKKREFLCFWYILLFISAVVYILLFRHGSSEGDIRTVIVLYWERYSFLNLWCYVWDDKQ